MKYPKIKNTALCQLLIYLPGLLIFLWIIAMLLIPDEWSVNAPLMLALFLLAGGFSLWYLFHNFRLLMTTDILFDTIRRWKKDREEYHTTRNGKDRAEIRKAILRRASLWGRRYKCPEGNPVKAEVFYRHGASWTVFRSMIEKRVAVVSVDTLTSEDFHLLAGQVRWLLGTVPKGKARFKTKEERKAPRAEVNVILFLANRVDDEVKSLARQPLYKTEESCLLPCVVECESSNYYVNCTGTYYEAGVMSRPVENIAAAMVKKLVFMGRLPKESRATQPQPTFGADLEMSLWEYLKSFREGGIEAEDELKKDRVRCFHRLRSGETYIDDDGLIWYKKDNKLAEYAFFPENDDDEMLVTLFPEEVWYYQKDESITGKVLLRDNLNRRKMKKGEAEEVRKRMEAALIEKGYHIAR